MRFNVLQTIQVLNVSVNSQRYHPPGQPRGIYQEFLPGGGKDFTSRAFDLKIN